MKKYNSNGFSAAMILIIIVVVGTLGSVGYYVYRSNHKQVAKSTPAPAAIAQPASGLKRFEDKEHKFLFDYPQDFEISSEKIWIDKPQGGLEIGVFKHGTVYKQISDPKVIDSTSLLVKLTVTNTNIEDVLSLSELSAGSDKKTFKICEVSASTFTLFADNNASVNDDQYVSEFTKDNLVFSFQTFTPDIERRQIHDAIVHSVQCL